MESSPLIQFRARAKSAIFTSSSNQPMRDSTLVLGNPSADLDSFISAVLISYCYTIKGDENKRRHFIPLVNLPAVPSSDLWRLRPEFGTALRLAVTSQTTGSPSQDKDRAIEEEKRLLEPHVVTIHDIQNNPKTKALFPTASSRDPTSTTSTTSYSDVLDVILVDHNAPSIPSVPDSYLSTLNIVGCVDHHVDESRVPSHASPRIIRTGIGSCTSLVVQHLRDSGKWPFSTVDGGNVAPSPKEAQELSLLALAPILIDTANLTAPGKVSDLDREIVSFLEDTINQQATTTNPLPPFDRETFYNTLSASKANSLNNLTIQEILDRDYKEWTESPSSSSTSSSQKIKIGISSCVKPISYLLAKSSEEEEQQRHQKEPPTMTSAAAHNHEENNHDETEPFLSSLISFSKSKDLDIFILMTAFTSSSSSSFNRELLLLPFPSSPVSSSSITTPIIHQFLTSHSQTLQLSPLSISKDAAEPVVQDQTDVATKEDKKVYIYKQNSLDQSRKQVAPMIRDVVRNFYF